MPSWIRACLFPFSAEKSFSRLLAALLFLSCGAISLMGLPLTKAQAGSTTMRAAAKPSPVTRFVAVGDTGSGQKQQVEVGQAMFQEYQAHPFPLVLILGDIIYDHGEVEKYARDRFEKPYQALLDNHVAFRVALGNHDLRHKNGEESLRYFRMPGRYYHFREGNVSFFVIDSNDFSPIQAQWLERSLAVDHAPWRIVAGHHPIYSSGQHGNNAHLKETLEPILVRQHVDMYLAGHDHNYERFAPKQGVQYIVSGGGGANLRDFNSPVPGSLQRIKDFHFLSFTVQGDQLWMRALNRSGQLLDELRINKSAKPAVPVVKPAA
jgi:hypothetical protein